MAKVIDVVNLHKNFGKVPVLKGIDFSVEEGSIYGFIGSNGAGKTTTIRILLGNLKKTSGEVKVLGANPREDALELHKRIAYVPGEVLLCPDLTGKEAINMLEELHGSTNENKIRELTEQFQLDTSKKIRTYSKGNKQKVVLIAALASDSELYILDEPTSGLDPLMERVFQEFIRELGKEGKTVFLSSHILSEVEALCDGIAIIQNGKIANAEMLTELRRYADSKMVVKTKVFADSLAALPGIQQAECHDGAWHCFVKNENLSDIMRYLTEREIQYLTVEPPKLESLFANYYDKKEM